MNLRNKLVIPLLFLPIAIGTLLHGYMLPEYKKSLFDEFGYFQSTLLSTLGNSLIPQLLTNDLAEIHLSLKDYKSKQKDWKQIVLTNEQHLRIYPIRLEKKGAGKTFSQPIYYKGKTLGKISVVVDSTKYIQKKQKIATFVGNSFLSILIILIVIAGFIQNALINKPIKLLLKATSGISEGDFSKKLPFEQRHDEIGRLTSSFSKMRVFIQNYQNDLRDQKLRLQAIMDNVNDAIISINVDGIVLSTNESVKNIFGYDGDELLEKSINIVMPEFDSHYHNEFVKRQMHRNFNRPTGFEREVYGRHKNGRTIPLDITIKDTTIFGQRMFIGIIRDISDRKKVEEELLNQHTIIKIIDVAQKHFIRTNNPNEAFIKLLVDILKMTSSQIGFVGEMIKEPNACYFNTYIVESEGSASEHKIYMENFENEIQEKINKGNNVTINESINIVFGKSEIYTFHSLLIIPLFDSGKLKGIIGIANQPNGYNEETVKLLDPIVSTCSNLISAVIEDRRRKRDAEELRIAKMQAEQAVKAKDQFLAVMSHEIRTPMNGVLGNLYLLEKTILDKKQQRYVNIAAGASEMLLVVLNDILDYSKMEASKLELESIDFDPLIVVEETADLLANSAHKKGLEFVTYVRNIGPCIVRGDPNRLRQVLTNLVNNAVKFTQEGHVEIYAKINNGTIDFSVVDTGIGIKAEQKNRLFNAFTQLDSSHARKYGGTGLGLVICKKLVNAMGSELDVESIEDVGTVFSFSLNLNVAKRYQVDSQSVHKQRILIVENNAALRTSLEKTIGDWSPQYLASIENPLLLNRELETQINNGSPYTSLFIDKSTIQCSIDSIMDSIHNLIDHKKAPKIILIAPIDDHENYQAEIRKLQKPIRQFELLNYLTSIGPDLKLIDGTTANEHPQYNGLLLLVEDNAVNQEVAKEILIDYGFQLDVCFNGLEAISAVKNKDYDLVLMDIQMPIMDGYEATKAIRRLGGKYNTLPIIAMTANALTSDTLQSLDIGMNDHINKPFNVDTMLETICKYIKSDTTPMHPHENTTDVIEQSINMAEGVERVGGSLKIFHKILNSFFAKHKDTAKEFNLFITNRDWPSAISCAHEIKGSSGNISANALYKISSDLEKYLKDKEYEQAVELSLSFNDELANVLKIIDKFAKDKPENADSKRASQ